MKRDPALTACGSCELDGIRRELRVGGKPRHISPRAFALYDQADRGHGWEEQAGSAHGVGSFLYPESRKGAVDPATGRRRRPNEIRIDFRIVAERP